MRDVAAAAREQCSSEVGAPQQSVPGVVSPRFGCHTRTAPQPSPCESVLRRQSEIDAAGHPGQVPRLPPAAATRERFQPHQRRDPLGHALASRHRRRPCACHGVRWCPRSRGPRGPRALCRPDRVPPRAGEWLARSRSSCNVDSALDTAGLARPGSRRRFHRDRSAIREPPPARECGRPSAGGRGRRIHSRRSRAIARTSGRRGWAVLKTRVAVRTPLLHGRPAPGPHQRAGQ
ncbi:hypothetical protein BH11ACT5_BH11ACT5_26640 [soil metagenome]